MVKNKNSQRSHAPAVSDPRFARAQHDPRFLRPKKEAFQVVLDDRFKDLLHPDSTSKRNGAKGKGKVDKYGRPISEEQQKQNQIQQLKGLYRIEGQQDDDDEEEEDESEEDEDEDAADDDDHELPTTQPGAQVDYARGEGELLSSSDEDDDTSDEEKDDLPADQDDSYSSVDEDELQATTAQPASMSQRQAKSEEMRGERTRRLAIVNMDWDHIRARDLFMVFSSLVSPTAPKLNKGKAASASSASRSSSLMTNGRVLSVRVYPSEFGRERMKKEDIEGPPRDIFRSADSQQASSSSSSSRKKRKNKKGRGGDEEDDEEEEEEEITVKSIIQVDEGGDFDEEALRKYQLERLRYYYAVAEFDSTEAASHVYNEIDGTEMERSANVFDLRFIPDEMEFPSYPLSAATDEDDPTKQDGWRDEYTQDSLEPGSSTASSKYRPLDFKTDALRHSRVKLTWDADDPERTRITKNIFAPSASAAAKKGGGKKGKKNPNILTLDEMRDDDFRAYLASATEDEDDDEGEEGGAESSRARFRALLNLDGSADGEAGSGGSENEETSKPSNPLKAALASSSKAASVWGRSRAPNGQVEGEMEITFTPGLSEAKARKELKQKKQNKSGGAGAEEEEEEDETTLDKYVRKQREKKERRKARQVEAGPNGDEGGAGEEQDGEGLGFDDPFFADDGDLDADMEAALAAHDAGESAPQPRSQPNPKKSAQQQQAQERDGEEQARKSKTQAKREAKLERKRKRKLAKAGIVEDDSKEGIDSDDDDDDEDGGRKARAEQGEFDVDVADERFQAVLEDHRFAIDPSHKAWKETKGMRKLVDERRKKARRT